MSFKGYTGRSKWILHRKLKYSICCLKNVILKIERDLSNSISNTSISGVKFSWTTLYVVGEIRIMTCSYSMQVHLPLPRLDVRPGRSAHPRQPPQGHQGLQDQRLRAQAHVRRGVGPARLRQRRSGGRVGLVLYAKMKFYLNN